MQKVSLVIPCYNEEHRLESDAILDFLQGHPHIRVLFVNDGSLDNTQHVIERLEAQNPAQVSCLTLPHNVGKAECVRQGMLNRLQSTDTAWLGFWDADLATPLDELDRMLTVPSEATKIILSCRVNRPGASVRRQAWRRIVGRIGATMISSVTGLTMNDPQCGAKLIHRDVAKAVFSEPFLSRWLFDVEILLRLKRAYPAIGTDDSAVEVPVMKWTDVPGSKMKTHHLFGSLIDLAKIALRYRLHKPKSRA
jgi:glycosyltransferase involved in cell wall biosynthesis